MVRDILRFGAVVWLCVCALATGAVAQETTEVGDIEYLKGLPGHPQTMRGSLRITPTQIEFLVKGRPQFVIDVKRVEYVAAQAQASLRSRTRETAMGITSAAVVAAAVAATGFGAAGPVALLFLKREKHLLSIEFLEAASQTRHLVLFDVRDRSALAVKKIIDTRLGLTPEYYRQKDQQEEETKRQLEAAATPAGSLQASSNLVVGDIQYFRYLLEKGTYAVLIFDRYIGFRPDGMSWARYRVPIREQKPHRTAGKELEPLYKSSRLVGFKFDGARYLFY